MSINKEEMAEKNAFFLPWRCLAPLGWGGVVSAGAIQWGQALGAGHVDCPCLGERGLC